MQGETEVETQRDRDREIYSEMQRVRHTETHRKEIEKDGEKGAER